jgi:hypothetical protein
VWTPEANSVKEWLASLSLKSLDTISICRLYDEARAPKFLGEIQKRAKEASIHESDASHAARFACIRHFIGRLVSHIKAVSVLVEAGRHYPRLFADYSIEVAIHAPNFTPPSYRMKSSINDIINRMVKNPQACEYYRTQLHSQEQKFQLALEKRIRDGYKCPMFKLRVHTKIILLDLFY